MRRPHGRWIFSYFVLSSLLLFIQTACSDNSLNPLLDAGVQARDAGMDEPKETVDSGPLDDAGSSAGDGGTEQSDGGQPETDAGHSPRDGGNTVPDAGSAETGDGGSIDGDAGTAPEDAGIDITDGGLGELDAGTTACGGSLFHYERLTSPGDAHVVTDATEDILVRLRAIPGLTVEEQTSAISGYRFFFMEYNQPADHGRPKCQRFTQRLSLLHKSDTAPMVLSTSGYYLSTSRHELTDLLGANQLSVEHRFFPPSIPVPADWSHLTIQQSAADFHRIVQAFKPIYGGRWLSMGVSKGGEAVVFFRRFYPQDVDATVAYVAPILRQDDERFPAFQDAVGGTTYADCRERIHTFQRTVLERRPQMLELLYAYAAQEELTYNQLGLDKALEHAVIETYFAFWQYGSPAFCDQFPGAWATNEELFNILDSQVGLSTFSDTGFGSIDQYAAYYYQAAVELGWPQPYEDFLGGLIQYPRTNAAPFYAPLGLPLVFRPQAMQDVQDWVSTQGERLMFIYGEFDPWSAAAYSLGNAKDTYLYEIPMGNHGATISQLPEPQRTQAYGHIRRWANVPSLRSATALPPRPQYPEFAPHLPPRLNR